MNIINPKMQTSNSMMSKAKNLCEVDKHSIRRTLVNNGVANRGLMWRLYT